MEESNQTLAAALSGDIQAFQRLFDEFQRPLKSYLYRLLANREDAEDLTHDTFVRAFDKRATFQGQSSLKTWVFQIATHLAYNYLERRKRWVPTVLAEAKAFVLNNPVWQAALESTHHSSPAGRYEMKEHIDTCFTCMAKTLPIENQIVLILRDVYGFSIGEIGQIIAKTEGVSKYLLQVGRQTMRRIFADRCALINKNGVCHQCSELNGWFNPEQDQQQALVVLDLVRGSPKFDRERLYFLRSQLVQTINPLESAGADLQSLLVRCNQQVMEAQE